MRVLVITAMYPSSERPAYGTFVRSQVEALLTAGVDVELLVLKSRWQKLAYAKGVLDMHRHLRRGSGVDLVHGHYGYVGAVARMQLGVPVVVTFHGDDLLGEINVQGRHTRFSRAVAAGGRLLARTVDAAIVQSEQMARLLRRTSVYVIPHEVDLDVFRPIPMMTAREALGLDPAKRYLLFAADPRIPVKRFPLARDAAARLRGQDPSVELLVVFRETQARLALYMSASDALVFPSYQEGSPNIVRQAMACNLPIVATDVGDVRRQLDGTPGCTVCDATVDAFVECVTAILGRRERTNGRERVRHMAPSAVATRVTEVYERTLAGRRHAQAGSTDSG